MSDWYPDANELLAELRRLSTPYCGPNLERYNEVWLTLQEWCELTEKALRMEIDEQLRRKFYACLRVWKIRDELVPNVIGPNGQRETWREWFAHMFHQSIDDFVAQAKEHNLRQRVMEYELAKFGKSPLEQKERAA